MTNLFQDAIEYSKTEDYYHGVITSMAMVNPSVKEFSLTS
jgi:hypothetical protein